MVANAPTHVILVVGVNMMNVIIVGRFIRVTSDAFAAHARPDARPMLGVVVIRS